MNICGIPYDVIPCEDSFDIDLHFGQIDYRDAKIKINSDTTEPMQHQSLCHEIVHGMLMNLGYNEFCSNVQFVQALAMAINQSFTVKGMEDGKS